MSASFQKGTKEQGPQSPVTPAQHYRHALAALDRYCRATLGGNGFSTLSDDQKDHVLTGIEAGSIPLAEGHRHSRPLPCLEQLTLGPLKRSDLVNSGDPDRGAKRLDRSRTHRRGDAVDGLAFDRPADRGRYDLHPR